MRYVNCESFLYRDMSVCLQEPHPKRRACSQTLLSGDLNMYIIQFAVHISHYLAYEIFNLKLWFENNLYPLRMDFLSIGFCKQTNKQRMTTFFT